MQTKKRPAAASSDASADEWPLADDKSPKPEEKEPDDLSPSPTIAAKFLQQANDGLPSEGNEFSDIQPAQNLESATQPADADSDSRAADGSPESVKPVTANEQGTPKRLSRRHVAGERPLRSRTKRGASPKEDVSKDPFDPEEFNRKFLGG